MDEATQLNPMSGGGYTNSRPCQNKLARQAESKTEGKLGETRGEKEGAGGQNKRKPARIMMAVGGQYTHSRGKGKGKFAAFLKCGNREWASFG